MQINYCSLPDYCIKTDYFPFDESKEIIAKLDWWEHENRTNTVRHKPSNYSLDTSLINSLGTSFQERLNNGCFSFLYFKDEIVAYCGLRIDREDGYIHRFASSPKNHLNHLGIVSRTIIPLHIVIAKYKGCKTYSITFNQERVKFIKWWKDGHYAKSKFVKVKGGGELVSKFEFKGIQKIYGIDQHVMTLDLSRPDLEEILPSI